MSVAVYAWCNNVHGCGWGDRACVVCDVSVVNTLCHSWCWGCRWGTWAGTSWSRRQWVSPCHSASGLCMAYTHLTPLKVRKVQCSLTTTSPDAKALPTHSCACTHTHNSTTVNWQYVSDYNLLYIIILTFILPFYPFIHVLILWTTTNCLTHSISLPL